MISHLIRYLLIMIKSNHAAYMKDATYMYRYLVEFRVLYL